MHNIGICGAHRTGKTTLAKALAKALNMPFVEIGTSAIFAKNNLDPAKPMDFRTRLYIQQQILKHAVEVWLGMDKPFICDRTPIDMMAYTLAEVQGDTLDRQTEQELLDYLVQCRISLDRDFGALVLVPPAIPIVDAIGKASPSPNYINHIHLLCLGLYNQSSIDGYIIPQHITNLNDRVANIKSFWSCK